MRFPHNFRSLAVCTAFLGALLLAASSASAQEYGLRVGVSGDPDQFYFGGHLETRPVVDRLHFRPNVEVGIGNDVTLVALNFEFAYRFSSNRAWTPYVGAGPALNLIFTEREDHSEGGFNILLGLAHRNGFFGEIKVGALDSPDFKFGIGFVLR
jgi:hypothetical protein